MEKVTWKIVIIICFSFFVLGYSLYQNQNNSLENIISGLKYSTDFKDIINQIQNNKSSLDLEQTKIIYEIIKEHQNQTYRLTQNVAKYAIIVGGFLLFYIILKNLILWLQKQSLKNKIVNKVNISKVLIIISIVWIIFVLADVKPYRQIENLDLFLILCIPSITIILTIILFKTYKEKE